MPILRAATTTNGEPVYTGPRGAIIDIFSFDPREHAQAYREQGWLFIKGGVAPEFLTCLQEYADREFGGNVVEGRGIAGTKQQALYEFPGEIDLRTALYDVIAEVGGLRHESMTISERHIKAYDADTPAEVPAHKDRLSSQVSVGLSIRVPPGSCLLAYPDVDVWPNPFNVSASLRESLAPGELPENILADAKPVEIYDEPGDVMMFPGASVWHGRRNAAGAINLYLKLNDFESDPLGEDPETPVRRERTLAVLRENDAIDDRLARPARRLDTIVVQRARDGSEYSQADVWGLPKVRLDDADRAILSVLDGGSTVSALLARAGAGSEASIRRLAERGVIDLS